ncbi:glycoside hydrolase family 3 N-terminal domain-containing protein [Croceicoccus sp. BE223]|uniref:glycoside hydrolase family 3 N-terminal domain-containing protein n=1 Tax=Croceicoccus sp. BE223 TaxID=2817716 RepID=UPI0028652030|nr:glycoside hydrolase family 3 N-terminal domain-containing protein [Croceicoccus sp. BE223]MDR7101786.1 beta-N-acetylhexosaminidase [Croceicoccus sp. BE223]
MIPVIFGLSGLAPTDAERAFFASCEPAGYILFGRNCESVAQMRALTDELRALHGRDDLLILIDQEGGRVTRMKPPVWPAYPPQGLFDRLYDVAPITALEAARCNALAIGLDLAEVGVSSDALPLLDVRQEGAHDVIGDRALGRDPLRVGSLGRAVLDGLAEAGVVGIVKHMPGHGRALCDSHKDLPRVTANEADLASDLKPFQTLRDAPMAMSAHIVFEAWDPDNPATQSPTVIAEVIRRRIGFDGLLMTDDIDMEALSGTIPERSAAAIAAGCDLVLNCWARMEDMEGICAALPEITPDARRRLDAAMAGADVARPFDRAGERAEAVAKRDALLAAAGLAAAGVSA